MATDLLASLDPPAVAGFYRRLAFGIKAKVGGDSLAAILLLHWLDGKGKDKVFPSSYVSDLDEVETYLRDTARPIFLSTKPTPKGAVGGVVPRIKGNIKCDPAGGPYSMHLEGNVETSLAVEARAAMGLTVEHKELDALFALHGFLLTSDVVVSATRVSNSPMYNVKFQRWTCKTSDEYHWNPDKHIKVPNPDFGSKEKGAVGPADKSITVYHRNAIRVEKAGLAMAFHDESESWDVSDASVTLPVSIRV
jgi:hypothetical protein